MRVQGACSDAICTAEWHYMPLGTIVKPGREQRLDVSDRWQSVLQANTTVDTLLGDEMARLVYSGHITVHYRVPQISSDIYFRVYVGASTRSKDAVSNKTKTGKSLRASWNVILGSVSRRLIDWYGGERSGSQMWPFATDERSLSEIFADLTPPSPSQEFLDAIEDVDCLLNQPLYSFQRETVAQMLERETRAAIYPDPTFVELRCLDVASSESSHYAFWVQPSTMTVLTERPFYTTAESGGILSEEMGAGKTVILLALILATRGQLSIPTKMEESNVLTSLSLRTHQTAFHRELRKTHFLPEIDRIPTLAEMTLHKLSVNPQAILRGSYKVRGDFESSPLFEALSRMRPFFLDSDASGRGVIKPDKREVHPVPVYLSRSTLVVVPSSLFEQWKGEFYKFCVDGSLNALFVNDTKAKMPRAQDLVHFDLVLTTMEWLGASNRKSASVGYVGICRCPGDPAFPNIPLCSCTEAPSINPIFLCRWRRLVVDEGHSSADLKTEYTVAASKLSVEHRWIVTGTPTRHLIGSIATPRPTRPLSPDSKSDSSGGSEEEKDLIRLAKMIGPYLRIEPFFTQKKYFEEHVSLPMRKGWRGAKAVLEAVLQQSMIRHPIEMVEAEVHLPAMTKETILLHLEPMQVQTYNFIQSTIVVNAMDSERSDEDYIFHPRNAKFLQATITNLFQSMFWHADQEFFDRDLESHLHNSTSSIERAVHRGRISVEDLELLRRANDLQHEAGDDTIWRKTMRREDVPYLTNGIPSDVQEAFSRYGSDTGNPLYHPDRLLKLRDAVCTNVNVETAELVLLGEKTARDDDIKETFIQAQREQAARPGMSKKSSKMPANQQAGQTKARAGVKEQGSSSLFGAGIISSSSSKLNFAIREILDHGEDEKFLVFSASLLSLMHLAEGLQLANIAFLEYTSECSPNQRRTNISQFNNVPMYRVFLMELKHGARGLNLVAASRVLFLEPVWAPDVEAQAIKRVHRTGQTRPVVVKTMAIRNTVEQEMLERRAGIVAKTTKMPRLTEEAGMRSYIENPRFLVESGNDTAWSLPLVPLRKKLDVASNGRETARMDLDVTGGSPDRQHKRGRSFEVIDKPGKRVRFASPDGVVPMELCNDAPESLEETVESVR